VGDQLAVEITLIRHAETEANASGVWQGRSDSSFSARGHDQLDRLAAVNVGRAPALVMASPLGRAQGTAAIFGEFETDERWAEMELGAWDGLTRSQVVERYPEDASVLARDDEFTPRGGETWQAFTERVESALAALIDRLDENERAVVVTHGGVIHVLVAASLGVDSLSRLRLPHNTSSTTIRIDTEGRRGVSVYNDAGHLNGFRRTPAPGVTEVLLFRHGETDGNVTRRWQGRSEGYLTATGRRQAGDLVVTAPSFDRLYSSPLSRARDTAAVIGAHRGMEVGIVEDLVEMDFGRWENLTADEAAALDPEIYQQIYDEGRDLPRGRTGERYADAGSRVARAVAGLIDTDGASTIAAVGHGGATRAFVFHVLGMSFARRRSLGPLRNTAMVAISYTESLPAIAAYNVAPHLGG
jgi:probable phosphoglycerate mutase